MAETLRAVRTPDNPRSNLMKILTTSGGLLPFLAIGGTTLVVGFAAGRLSAPVAASDRTPATVTIQSQEIRTLRSASPSESATVRDSSVDRKPDQGDLKKILGNPNPLERARGLDAMLAGVDAPEVKQLLDWVNAMPDGAAKRVALGKVMQRWGQLDGSAASAFGIDAFQQTGNATVLRNALLGWAQTDPSSSMQYLQGLGLSRGLMNEFSRDILGIWSNLNPQAAAEYLQSNPDSLGGRGAVGGGRGMGGPGGYFGGPAAIVAANWAAQDPQAAANWALSLSQGQGEGRQGWGAMNQVIDRWVNQDPNAAASFVGSQSAGPAKDAMLASLVRGLAADDPASTMKWVSLIGNQDIQRGTTMGILAEAGVFTQNGPDITLAQSLISSLPQNVQQQVMQGLTNRGGPYGGAGGGARRGTGANGQ